MNIYNLFFIQYLKVKNKMIVMKFGGTSLANAERIKNVADIIKTRLNKKPIVVVSAVSKITDNLISLAKESSKGINPNEKTTEIINIHKKIIKELNLNEEFLTEEFIQLHDTLNGIYLLKELSLRSLDIISSFGEIFSSKILSAYLNSIKINSKQYNGWDIGIITDNNFTNADIIEETYENIKDNLKNLENTPIVTGFIAKNKEGEITTLGRGGSDYTASIIGAALGVEEIEIWTDVDGVKTADPKIVENAKQWDKIPFAEASEMSYFGAKVLHPKTIRPAINKSIPVRILNTYNIENKGTLVVKEDSATRYYQQRIDNADSIANLYLGAAGSNTAHSQLDNNALITNGGASDMVFSTGNQEVMRLQNGGNVGIGTQIPTTDANPEGNATGNLDVGDVWLRDANGGNGAWASASGGGWVLDETVYPNLAIPETSWYNLDLSAKVGNKSALVLLKVCGAGSKGTGFNRGIIVKPYSDPDDFQAGWGATALNQAHLGVHGYYVLLMTATDSNGRIGLRSTAYGTVQWNIKLVGYSN